MSRKGGRIGAGWLLIGVIVLVSGIVFAVLLGPKRALLIASASAMSTAVDGIAEGPGPHRIPVVDVRIDQAYLDTLGADLPWSGDQRFPATLIHNGIEHDVKFRYRGSYTPSHFLGEKRSFRLTMKKSGPFAPYRKLNFINPKALNMLTNHLGNWIAGRMGVAVPYDEMVFVRLNGSDYGVMEMFEQPDGSFHRIRGISATDVPVYRGEFPGVKGRELPERRQLWRSAANWQYTSDADSTLAHAQLQALIGLITLEGIPIEVRRDSLAKLIDVDAYLRYMAAILVVNTQHMDQFHNQWLVMHPDGRFHPIWWDGLLMFAPKDEPLYFIHDALAFWILQVPEWRLQRDRYAWEHLANLHGTKAFEQHLDRTIERIMPSVLADRNKYGNVSLAAEDVHRTSVVHVIGSLASMRASVPAYWQRTMDRLRANAVKMERGENVRITSTSEAAIRLTWTEGESESKEVYVNGNYLNPEWDGKECTFVLHRTLKLPEGSWNRPFASFQHYLVEPLDATISFPRGIPGDLRITNAVTDERSPERRIGIGRWLLGTVIVVALLFAGFSLMPAALLEGEWPMRISAQEVSLYAGLFDQRPQDDAIVQVESYRFGASQHDGLCLTDHKKPGWQRRWFEAEGYGDSVDVRRSREIEGAWEVRFHREELFNRQRRIMLIPADVESIRAKYLEILADELGLLTPEISFVRIIACGQDLGIFMKQEHLGPEFMEKYRMPDAVVFKQGVDPERPDQLAPDIDGDTLASRIIRSLLQQLSNDVGKDRPEGFPYGVDTQAAISWLLLRSMESDDPYQGKGVFAYRWSTGMIVPVYQYTSSTITTDTTSTFAFNPISALWWRASFRNGANARRDELLNGLDRLKARFAQADSAWLPILAGNTSLSAAQARAGILAEEMHERLEKMQFEPTHRTMVPRVGYALAPPEKASRHWPGDDDQEVLARLRALKAEIRGDTIIFYRGKYTIDTDLIFPYGSTVVMEQGARFTMGPGASMLCLGPLLVRGTMRNPIFIRAAMEDQPFGSLAVSCFTQEQCHINGLRISGGSGAIINGIRHDAMLSIIGASNTTMNVSVIGGSSGDGVNINGGRVELVDCLFEGSGDDLVDLDFVTAAVLDCVFKGGAEGASGDALRARGSQVSAERCRVSDMRGTAVSAGEESVVLIRSGTFSSNRIAIASHDGSTVNAEGNTFTNNATVFSARRTEPIYGGGHVLLGTNTLENNGREREVDGFSTVVVQEDPQRADVVKR